MASNRLSSKRASEPARKDDLKLINGIGPTVEKRLLGDGIYTFARLAAFLPGDIAAKLTGLPGMSARRIIREGWIGQARRLASEAQKDLEPAAVQPAPTEHHHAAIPLEEPQKDTETMALKEQFHPATFTVDLLLDENNDVHSVHVMHVESQREHSWTGWPNTELVDFLSESVKLNIPSNETSLPISEEPEQVPALISDSEPKASVASQPALAGTLRLSDMKLLTSGSSEPRRLISHDQPIDVRLTLDLSDISVPGNSPLDFKASIYCKSRSNPSGQIVGESEGTFKPADNVTIDIEGNLLTVGSYRMAATVILALPGTKPTAKPDCIAVIEGGRVRVY